MRPKVVAAVLMAVLLLFGVLWLVSDFPADVGPDSTGANTQAIQTEANAGTPGPTLLPPSSLTNNSKAFTSGNDGAAFKTVIQSTPSGTNKPTIEQEKMVRKRISDLYTLAMNDDTASRDVILSELMNPDRRIRAAALEAAIQYNDRSVIPYLKQAADQTEDPREKVAILDAIDFINLPSLSEYIAQRKAMGLPDVPGLRIRPEKRSN